MNKMIMNEPDKWKVLNGCLKGNNESYISIGNFDNDKTTISDEK
jgi:hypothetical protein